MTLVPLHIDPRMPDVRDFQTFAVPARTLTREEREVYRNLAADWAVLDASAQRELYALLLAGRLTDCLSEIFVNTSTAVVGREEGIQHPQVRELAHEFHKTVLTQHAQHLTGLHATTARLFAETLSRDMSPKSQGASSNFWRRLLGRGTDG